MICPTCIYYHRLGQSHPIAPVCSWEPAADLVDQLRAILPAPALSRLLIKSTPNQVEACGAYASNGVE